MAKKLAPMFLTPPPRPSSVETSTGKTRTIKQICTPSSNYHTVTENTVNVNGKGATNWECNSAECVVYIFRLKEMRNCRYEVLSTGRFPEKPVECWLGVNLILLYLFLISLSPRVFSPKRVFTPKCSLLP